MSQWDRNHRLLKGFVIFFVLLGFIGHSSAFETSQLQWDNGISGKLIRGEMLAYNGYSVEVIGFPAPVESAKYKQEPEEPVEPFVELNISKNGGFIDTVPLGLAESYIAPDGGLRVTATGLPGQYAKEWTFENYAPWALIEMDPRGTPSLGISIQTDQDKYVSSYTTEIIATVNLHNTGSADAVNVDMIIDTELPINRGYLKYHYDKIKIGESITETITFASPIVAKQKMYNISANVSGHDVTAIPYTATSKKNISMAFALPVLLSVSKSTVNKMYLKDYTIVTLTVKNNGRIDAKNVSITDSLPGGFGLIGNQSLHWDADIPVNEEWNYHYLIRPLEANKEGIVFPAATAGFILNNDHYSVRSNLPTIVVYGPKIVLRKLTNVSEIKPGDTFKVTVIAENKGNTPTKVTIKDNLPKDATVVSGITSYEELLEANKNVSFSYILKFSSNESIKLPPASADYYELGSEGRKISTMSQELEINLKSLNETPANPGKPVGWMFVTSNGNSPIWDNVYHSGLKSIKISVPGATDGKSGYPQSDLITAESLKNYTLSAWVKTLNAYGTGAPAVRVVELGSNKSWIRQTTLYFNLGTNGWTQKQIDFQTGPNTSYFYVYSNIWNGYGTFWVDDIMLKLKSKSLAPNLVANPGFENGDKSPNLTIPPAIGGSNALIVNGSNKFLSNESISNETASKPRNEVNTLLNLLFGCNDNGNSTFKACNFFKII
ncbi:Uncharacterised protein [uncultured archaeon]|nr:Uncharacterised protein [uncultured archaeon]